ncbi:C4-dicarboxylate ABC transporter [Pseudomonas aeruginosa]|nr:C4-dicarboxylate ABC transporter [Pseudomonas aeruginosa]
MFGHGQSPHGGASPVPWNALTGSVTPLAGEIFCREPPRRNLAQALQRLCQDALSLSKFLYINKLNKK